MKKTLLSLLGLLCFMIMQAQVAKTVTMTQAGTLSSILTADEKSMITDLTLTGPIDARDFKTMRDLMPLLAVLDVESSNIEAYSGSEGTYPYSSSESYPANEIPSYAFCYDKYNGKKTIKTVKLPTGITSIGNSAYSHCSGLTAELNLPSGLTSIGEWAFQSCSGLTGELKLPASLTSIGRSAFIACSGLTGVDFPSGLTSIEYSAFSGCSGLTGVDFPSGLTSIGESAFYNCSGLTGELKLPASLISIGNYAFSDCSGLTSVRSYAKIPPVISSYVFGNIKIAFVPKGSKTTYQSANYWNNFTIIDEEKAYTLHISTPGTLGVTLLSAGGRPNSVTSLTLSGELNSDDFFLIRTNMPLVYTIDMEGLSNISIPDNAFAGKATLLNMNLPSGLTSIGNGAFYNCSGLTGELKLPSGLRSIGNSVFSDCSGLSGELKLPAGITSIGSSVFSGCSGLTGELKLPSGLRSIGNSAFSDCSGLSGELKLPSGLTSIGSAAFSGCSGLRGVEFPSGLTSIGNGAFYSCRGLTGELILPAGLTSIESQAFSGCSGLTGELKLPSGLISIGNSAFQYCRDLTAIHIKKNVKSIRDQAFSGCSNVSKMTCEAVTPPILETGVFSGINTITCELHVTQGCQMNYLLAPQWGNFVNIIEMDMPAESYLTSFVITPGGTVQSNGSAVSNGSRVEIKAGESMKLTFAPQGGYALDQVLFDGEDVTAQVQNNQWTSPAVSKAVTVSVSFKTVQYEVAILTVGSGTIAAHIVEYNSTHTYRLAATEGYLIENVTLNGTDVTPDLENGKLTLHNISEDQTLVITSKRDGESSEIGVSTDKTIRTWKANGQLFVESTEEMMAAEVLDMSGRTACSISKTAYAYVLNLSAKGVYVVRIRTVNGEVKTVKVTM